MKTDMKNNSKGAVTIFLILVLVPMLTVTSLFVDGSKMQLAKSVVESSAEVALDSALTSYDLDLKDIYGLFATAQDMSEVYDNCEKYFKDMISMNGFSNEDTNDSVAKIIKALKFSNDTEEITNFLQMSLLKDAEITGVKGATLANPTILKQQIVDFMKYRSPINTGLSFIEGLNAFKTLNDQKKLVDARQNYYEEQSKVMQKLKAAWDELAKYNALDLDGNGEKEHEHSYMQEAIISLFDNNNIEDAYEVLVQLYFKNVAYSSYSYDKQNDETYYLHTGITGEGPYIKENNVPTPIGPTKSYSSSNIKASDLDSLLSKIDSTCDSIGKFEELTFPNDGQDRYEVQYWLRNISNYKNIASKVKTLIETKLNLENAYSAAVEHDEEEKRKYEESVAAAETEKEKDEEEREEIEIYQPNYIFDKANYDVMYNNAISKCDNSLAQFENSVNTNITPGRNNALSDYGVVFIDTKIPGLKDTLYETLSITGCKASMELIDGTVKDISDRLTNMYDVATKMHEHLYAAKNNIKSAINSIKGEELKQAKDEWEKCANKTTINQTSQAQQDQQELKDLDSAFDTDSMQELVDNIDAIDKKLIDLIDQIDNFKFKAKPIKDIKTFDDFKNAITQITHNTLSEGTLKSKAIDYKNNNYQNGKMDTTWLSEHSSRINLSAHNNCVDDFKFYKYLVKQFSNKSGEEANQDAYDNLKKTISSNAANNVNATSDVKVSIATIEESGLPSAKKTNNDLNCNEEAETNVDNNKKNTVMSSDNLFAELGNMGANFIDNLYVSDYIMSMFSYNTISTKEPGATDDPKPQTLTLKDINADNNKYYLGEVEYIVFGNTDTNKNVNTAYASIYGVRLAFNLIYAFSASEIRDVAMSIAAGISAATCGLVPAPLIQAVIIIAAACMESGIDISLMKQHEKIVLFKTQATWQTDITGLKGYMKAQAAKIAIYEANSAIDKGAESITKLLDATDEELSALFKEKKDVINDYLDGVVEDTIGNITKEVIQQFNLATNSIVSKHLQSGGMTVDEKGNTTVSLNTSQYETIINEINKSIDQWGESWQTSNLNLNPLILDLQLRALDIAKSFVNQELVDIFANFDEENIETKINEINTDISRQITSAIDDAYEKVDNYKNNIKKEVENSINNGAKELKSVLQKEMLGLCGDSGTINAYKNTEQYSLLSFAYEDYLRFFCMVALYTNEEPTLLRTADLIQINIVKINSTENSKSTFDLSKSYAFISMKANVDTKPLFIGLDLFDDYLNKGSDATSWTSKEYKLYKGY